VLLAHRLPPWTRYVPGMPCSWADRQTCSPNTISPVEFRAIHTPTGSFQQTIVATNKDPGTLFQIAPLCVVGDLFQIVPALTASFQEPSGKIRGSGTNYAFFPEKSSSACPAATLVAVYFAIRRLVRIVRRARQIELGTGMETPAQRSLAHVTSSRSSASVSVEPVPCVRRMGFVFYILVNLVEVMHAMQLVSPFQA